MNYNNVILFQCQVDNCRVDNLKHLADLGNLADLGLIYAIHCTQNNRFCIGMTVVQGCKPPKQRQIRHFAAHLSDLKNQRHCCKTLQQDWNPYGEDAFSFNLLEGWSVRAPRQSGNESPVARDGSQFLQPLLGG